MFMTLNPVSRGPTLLPELSLMICLIPGHVLNVGRVESVS